MANSIFYLYISLYMYFYATLTEASYRLTIRIIEIKNEQSIKLLFSGSFYVWEYIKSGSYKMVEVDESSDCNSWTKYKQPLDLRMNMPIIQINHCNHVNLESNTLICVDLNARYSCSIGQSSSSTFEIFRSYRSIKNSISNIDNDVILRIELSDNAANLSSSNKLSIIFSILAFILLIMQVIGWIIAYYMPKTIFNKFSLFFKKIGKNRALNKNKIHIANKDEKSDICSICLDNIGNGHKLRMTKCRHLFHKKCLDPWLLNFGTCPLCKLNIMKSEKKNNGDVSLQMTTFPRIPLETVTYDINDCENDQNNYGGDNHNDRNNNNPNISDNPGLEISANMTCSIREIVEPQMNEATHSLVRNDNNNYGTIDYVIQNSDTQNTNQTNLVITNQKNHQI